MTAVASAGEPQSTETVGGAVMQAMAVVGQLARWGEAGVALPAPDEWRRVRAVIGGALPQPSAAERAATVAERRLRGELEPGARDGEALSLAARAVASGAWAASRALVD
eukprot:2724412-Prymnesium_polylepis.1